MARERFYDPKPCACVVDTLASCFTNLKGQVKEDKKFKEYSRSQTIARILGELLKEVAYKCNLIREYNRTYSSLIEKIIDGMLIHFDKEVNAEEILSLIDELRIAVWSEICKEPHFELPMGKVKVKGIYTTDLTPEEMEEYGLTEGEQEGLEESFRETMHLK